MSDKSLLAKLLATENITVQKNPSLKTAMFDLKNRVLMLPIWQGISNDLEDLLLVHETGHALDTPSAEEYKQTADDLAAKIFPGEKITDGLRRTIQGFLNVIEDARIDKRQKRRYPGCRRNYLIGYKELVDRDFFGTAKRDVNAMNFIDRLNMYFKGGNIHSNLTFSSEEKVMLKKVENAETWAEVVSLTEEIYIYCKKKLEEMNEMELTLIADDDGDAELDSDNWDEYDDDGDFDEDGDSQGYRGEGGINGSASAGDGAGESDRPVNAPRSETDETWQRKSEEIVKNENSTFVYLTMPTVNWDKAVHDYKKVLTEWRDEVSGKNLISRWSRGIDAETHANARKDMMAWKMKEKESISFMVKEFEQRKAAELYARISVAKTGVIDTNKLHSYKYNDDIFRRLATIPKGKNHGFVMFIDWSGSMHYNLMETLKQTFSLALFCKQIGVPFELYAFKDSGSDCPFSYIGKTNVIRGQRVVLRNFLSSRMNTEEMNFAMSMLWCAGQHCYINADGMGGTPLNDAIMIAPKVVEDFIIRNKVEITNVVWLTDGESNGPAGVENSTEPRTLTKGHQTRYFYVDPITHKTYDWHPHEWSLTRDNTNTLLRILKDRINCNLVGFFLYERCNFKSVENEFNIANGNPEAYAKARKFWSDNKYYPVRSAGYDEYYIIDTKSMKNTENNLEIDNSGEKKMTVRKMASAFSKFAQKKTVNRVLLRQFVERIAKQSKKVA
jgi:hypothetical protein